MELFSDVADEHGYLVLAPCFAYTSEFPLTFGETARWDLHRLAMIDDGAGDYALAEDRVSMFGYSAGGQFARRFLFLHPERLEQVLIGAPGTITTPTFDEPWPDGLANVAELTGKEVDRDAVRRQRILLYVGDQDLDSTGTALWKAANRYGLTRLERARRPGLRTG